MKSGNSIQSYLMKFFLVLTVVPLLFILESCELDRKDKQLQQKADSLHQREQQLILKEKILEVKEQELLLREIKLDSTIQKDTSSRFDSTLLGKWAVKMVCSETSCTGSAVGDTKNEQWEITAQGTQFIVKAMSAEQLVRVYTGIYTGNTLELIASVEKTSDQPAAKMVVRLHIVNENKLEGQREIVRENSCKVIYTMEMDKQ